MRRTEPVPAARFVFWCLGNCKGILRVKWLSIKQWFVSGDMISGTQFTPLVIAKIDNHSSEWGKLILGWTLHTPSQGLITMYQYWLKRSHRDPWRAITNVQPPQMFDPFVRMLEGAKYVGASQTVWLRHSTGGPALSSVFTMYMCPLGGSAEELESWRLSLTNDVLSLLFSSL